MTRPETATPTRELSEEERLACDFLAQILHATGNNGPLTACVIVEMLGLSCDASSDPPAAKRALLQTVRERLAWTNEGGRG